MINEISALWTPGPWELIVIFVVFFIIFVIPAAALIILFVIYVTQKNKEKQKLRLEVEKLTEEVNKLKQGKQYSNTRYEL